MKKKERGKLREEENEGKGEECMQEDVHALYIHDTILHRDYVNPLCENGKVPELWFPRASHSHMSTSGTVHKPETGKEELENPSSLPQRSRPAFWWQE